MKKLLTIFALLISVVAIGQESKLLEMGQSKLTEAWPSYQLSKPQNISFGITAPTHDIEIKVGDKTLNFDFKDDSLIVTGDAKLDESAKVFIDFCRKYMKTKIDSLEDALKDCKEILNKPNYIPKMGNSSIYREVTDTAGLIFTANMFKRGDGKIVQIIGQDDKNITFQMLLDYEKECAKDTIKATQYTDQDGTIFIVDHVVYQEAFYEKQLAEMGYKLAYRHYFGFDSDTKQAKIVHYFVKEATLKGFIQWYKEKGK